MEKLNHLPLGLFTALSLKVIVLGANNASIAGLLVLGALAAVFHIKAQSEEIKRMNDKLEILRTGVNERFQVVDNMKSQISALSMQNFKPTAPSQQVRF